jgi:hypothetical protein
MKEKPDRGWRFSFTCFGKKGRDWVRKKGGEIQEEYLGVVGATFGFSVASTVQAASGGRLSWR